MFYYKIYFLVINYEKHLWFLSRLVPQVIIQWLSQWLLTLFNKSNKETKNFKCKDLQMIFAIDVTQLESKFHYQINIFIRNIVNVWIINNLLVKVGPLLKRIQWKYIQYSQLLNGVTVNVTDFVRSISAEFIYRFLNFLTFLVDNFKLYKKTWKI